MSHLQDIRNFLLIVDQGSISAAAEYQHISTAAASKRLQQLEHYLGTRLLTRNTRQQRLSEAGEYYYQQQKNLLSELDRVDEYVRDLQGLLCGELRINLPNLYGKLRLTSHLLAFARQHQGLKLDCHYSDDFTDAQAGEFDLIIRIGRLADSGLIARALQDIHIYVVASPAYLARHDALLEPQDLSHHNCLEYSYDPNHSHWNFVDSGGSPIRVATQGNFRSNDGDSIKQALMEHHGCALMPDFLVENELQNGELQRVLENFPIEGMKAWALYPNRHYLPEKTRKMIRHLQHSLTV